MILQALEEYIANNPLPRTICRIPAGCHWHTPSAWGDANDAEGTAYVCRDGWCMYTPTATKRLGGGSRCPYVADPARKTVVDVEGRRRMVFEVAVKSARTLIAALKALAVYDALTSEVASGNSSAITKRDVKSTDE